MPQTHAMPRDCTQSDEGDAEERQYTDKDLVSPLPKLQLFVVLLMQLAEPVTASFLYPFVNRLVVLSGVTKGDERKAGYYVGLLVCFSVSAFVCLSHIASLYLGFSLLWGRVFDGRHLGIFGRGIWAKTGSSHCTTRVRRCRHDDGHVCRILAHLDLQSIARGVQREPWYVILISILRLRL